MMRALMTWLRVAAPPPWTPYVLLSVAVSEMIYGFTLGLMPGGMPELLGMRDFVWMFVSVWLGARRVSDFHPLFHPKYREWLRLTPWTSRLPLPLGPLHLIPQDALWLALIWSVWHDPQISPLYLPLVFLASYLGVVCFGLAATSESGVGWLLAFGLGEVVRQWHEPLAALVIACWLYFAAWIGLRRSMARFPWPAAWPLGAMQVATWQQPRQWLGWPLDQLLVRRGDLGRRPILKLAAVSLLLGWWAYCSCSLVTNPLDADYAMRLLLLITLTTAVPRRVLRYWIDYRAPISLWGRLWTLRWIIPRYDHILVTPALILLVASLLPLVLAAWQVPMLAAQAATISLVVFLALAMPPSLERWRLSGFFRIVPGGTNRAEFEKI